MRLYQAAIPQRDNNGSPLLQARAKLTGALLEAYGGLTIIPDCSGLWRDPQSGRVYRDKVDLFQVGAETNPGALKRAFSEFYPDQKALALATIGDMDIITL